MNGLDKLRQPWMVDAACQGYRTELWFPTDHDHDGRPLVDPIVMQRCGECPVALDCLTYALENDVDGIWAGTTPAARRAIRRRRRIHARPLDHPDHQPHQPEETEAS